MKVLIVGPAWPLRGGLATYNERLARAYKDEGHECDILSFSLQYPSLLFPGKTQFSSENKPDDLTIYSLINSINPISWIRTGNIIRKKKYDLVVFRYWMSFMAPAFGTIARIIKQNRKTKILAICDNLIPHEKRFFDKAFTNYFISKCDGFLTMSLEVKQQIIDLNKSYAVDYTPHPMYDMFGPHKSKSDARKKLKIGDGPVLLFFGFIRKYKGLHLLLDAMADTRVKALNIKLIVAGEFYEDSKPYFEQIEKLGLKDNITISDDFIPNSAVSDYFCAADAVIQTYLNATQSGVTQIAYFYNKPMIVTNVGGLAELVPDGKVGLVCEVNATSVADAIIRFYENKMEEKMIPYIEEGKKAFEWNQVILKLNQLSGF